MKDKLERFIRDNRDAFDTEVPQEAIWRKIRQKLVGSGERKAINLRRHFMLATAIAVILLIASVTAFQFYNSHKIQREKMNMAQADENYTRLELQYTSIIEEKRTEIERFKGNDPVLYRNFSADLNHLDQSCRELKGQLPVTPNPEILLNAILRNLQLQTDLLTRQLQIIKSVKTSKGHERIRI